MENQSQKEITEKEILEISLRIERDGKAFYKDLSDLVTNMEAKKFFQAMSKEESLHEIQLKKLFQGKGSKTYGWEKKNSLGKFITSNFKTDIFPNLDEIFDPNTQFESLQKALDFAINAESTSKEFYAMLGEYCDDFEAKTVLVLLEKSETDHLKRILEIKEQLFNT